MSTLSQAAETHPSGTSLKERRSRISLGRTEPNVERKLKIRMATEVHQMCQIRRGWEFWRSDSKRNQHEVRSSETLDLEKKAIPRTAGHRRGYAGWKFDCALH